MCRQIDSASSFQMACHSERSEETRVEPYRHPDAPFPPSKYINVHGQRQGKFSERLHSFSSRRGWTSVRIFQLLAARVKLDGEIVGGLCEAAFSGS